MVDGISKKSNKKRRKKQSGAQLKPRDGGAPSSLLTTLLAGVPFLIGLVLYDAIRSDQVFVASATMMALLIEGLAVSFFWRRLPGSQAKSRVALGLTVLIWLYMVGMAAASVLTILLPSTLKYGLMVSAIALVMAAGLGGAFIILWGIQTSYKKRVQTFAMTGMGFFFALVLVTAGGVLKKLEATQFQEVTLSAQDFGPDVDSAHKGARAETESALSDGHYREGGHSATEQRLPQSLRAHDLLQPSLSPSPIEAPVARTVGTQRQQDALAPVDKGHNDMATTVLEEMSQKVIDVIADKEEDLLGPPTTEGVGNAPAVNQKPTDSNIGTSQVGFSPEH